MVGNCRRPNVTRLIPKLFPGHVLGDATLWSTSFVSQSPGTIADQWECKDLDGTTKTSDISRKEFWYQPRTPARVCCRSAFVSLLEMYRKRKSCEIYCKCFIPKARSIKRHNYTQLRTTLFLINFCCGKKKQSSHLKVRTFCKDRCSSKFSQQTQVSK